MGPKTKQLIEILDQIIAILESDGESHWRKWIATSKSRLTNSDFSGIGHLLSAYGGMGSFSDLVIGQTMVNGKLHWKERAGETNERLDALRTEAYRLADFIKRNQLSGPFPSPEIPAFDSVGRLVPPWIKYPNLRRGSMGWRMGMCESFLDKFRPWWKDLSTDEQDAYRLAYPEPEEWQGFL